MGRTCYYDLLGLDFKAEPDDIKKAFRKEALIWHPDKNPSNVDVAKKRFQLIQEAYECLSNPHERAWYDNHRSEILGGAQGKGTAVDVYAFFSREAFDGFDDTHTGFFTVYHDLFVRIDAEENSWMEDPYQRPNFGNSTSPWEKVSAFYQVWSDFSTAAPFGRAALWKLSDAPNRDIRRAMDAENRKAIAKAKKEYSEQVRKLVAWIKHKDPRVLERQRKLAVEAYEASEKAEMERQAQQEQQRIAREKQRILEAERAQEFRRYREELKAKGQAFADSQDEESDTADNREDHSQQVPLVCKPCKKNFKSKSQLLSHCASKKHLQTCRKLKVSPDPPAELMSSSSDTSELPEDVQVKKVDSAPDQTSDQDQINEEPDRTRDLTKPSQCPQHSQPPQHSEESCGPARESEEPAVTSEEVTPPQNGKAVHSPPIPQDKGIVTTADEGGARVAVEARDESRNEGSDFSGHGKTGLVGEGAGGNLASSAKKKKRRAAKNEKSDGKVLLRCLVCDAAFESRNKLFQHVELEKHAAFKDVVDQAAGKKRGGAAKNRSRG